MQDSSVHPASVSEVRDEIQAISRSRLFAQSRRRIELLEYLCNMVLLGRQDQIKESTIALELFARTSEFDDKKDAIVRVEAHRLRQRLAKYYATEGTHDRLVIELIPGGYIPRFIMRPPEPVAIPAPIAVIPPVRPRRLPPYWILIAGVAILMAGVFGAVALSGRRPSPVAPAAALVPGPWSAGSVRILAGSLKPYIDRAGRRWLPDNYFAGGVTQPGPADFVGRPPDPSIYRTMRAGDFSYAIPAPPGVYELRLHFAEPTFRNGMDVGIDGGENQRHFAVSLNGVPLLYDLDVVADSGNSPVDIRAYRDVTPAADGFVHLQFQSITGQAFINAIELVPGVPGRILPIRIRAGDSSFTDHAGNVWNPDDYFIGGRLSGHKGDVSRTPDPDLYASERYGNFSYAIPVPPGRYAATLYFAETFWDPDSKSLGKGGIGSRVFSVSCNGADLLPDFDVLKESKPFQAVSRTFYNLRPNGQGKLLFAFSPATNYASVKAIEVKDEQDRAPR